MREPRRRQGNVPIHQRQDFFVVRGAIAGFELCLELLFQLTAGTISGDREVERQINRQEERWVIRIGNFLS